MTFENKCALVIGGTSGIGKEIVLEFSDRKIRANFVSPPKHLPRHQYFLKDELKKKWSKKLKDTPLGKVTTIEDNAKLFLFLLSDGASFIIGENIWINESRL